MPFFCLPEIDQGKIDKIITPQMNNKKGGRVNSPIQWLLEGPAYIQYRTRVDLLQQPENDPDVQASRLAMIRQPEVIRLVESIQNWPGKPLSSHKSASQPFHTLNFLTDLGLKHTDAGMQVVCDRVMDSASLEGPFRLPINIGLSRGGTGQDTAGWALCDAPNLVYALVKLGYGNHPSVQKAIAYLLSIVQDFGWPCVVSKELGSFHGPGRRDDPCPYANLVMLKVIGLFPDLHNHPAAVTGIRILLQLWHNRRELHPYIFYMGTDFCKLKAPLIWYDILHVMDVLSVFEQAKQERDYLDMLSIITSKARPDGGFMPESIYLPYKAWDFGQKKQPSRWLTLLIYRIMSRSDIKPH